MREKKNQQNVFVSSNRPFHFKYHDRNLIAPSKKAWHFAHSISVAKKMSCPLPRIQIVPNQTKRLSKTFWLNEMNFLLEPWRWCASSAHGGSSGGTLRRGASSGASVPPREARCSRSRGSRRPAGGVKEFKITFVFDRRRVSAKGVALTFRIKCRR